MIGIYRIRNNVSNKCYIGQSIDVARRISRHIYDLKADKHINKHLQSAWNKYGESSFEIEVLQTCESYESLNEIETLMIFQYDSCVNGYNKSPGGESGHTSFLGRSHSEESILKMRNHRLGKKLPLTTIANMKRSAKGFQGKHTEETKQKISEANKGRTVTQETRRKISEARMGHIHDQSTKDKISEAKKGIPMKEDVKKKISESKRTVFTEEDVQDIENRLNNGESYRRIAKSYECSHMTLIRRFKHKKGE